MGMHDLWDESYMELIEQRQAGELSREGMLKALERLGFEPGDAQDHADAADERINSLLGLFS